MFCDFDILNVVLTFKQMHNLKLIIIIKKCLTLFIDKEMQNTLTL